MADTPDTQALDYTHECSMCPLQSKKNYHMKHSWPTHRRMIKRMNAPCDDMNHKILNT